MGQEVVREVPVPGLMSLEQEVQHAQSQGTSYGPAMGYGVQAPQMMQQVMMPQRHIEMGVTMVPQVVGYGYVQGQGQQQGFGQGMSYGPAMGYGQGMSLGSGMGFGQQMSMGYGQQQAFGQGMSAGMGFPATGEWVHHHHHGHHHGFP